VHLYDTQAMGSIAGWRELYVVHSLHEPRGLMSASFNATMMVLGASGTMTLESFLLMVFDWYLRQCSKDLIGITICNLPLRPQAEGS
jgi:hypothetical protein